MSSRDSLLFFRFTAPLPLVVDGGITKWEIKNKVREKQIDTVAACLDTKQVRCIDTGEVITLIDGRARETQSSLMGGA